MQPKCAVKDIITAGTDEKLDTLSAARVKQTGEIIGTERRCHGLIHGLLTEHLSCSMDHGVGAAFCVDQRRHTFFKPDLTASVHGACTAVGNALHGFLVGRSHRLAKGTQRPLKNNLIGNNVRRGPAVDRAEGQHRWGGRVLLAADDRLQLREKIRRD